MGHSCSSSTKTHRAEKSKSTWPIRCQKLIETTVGSRWTRARNQGETTTLCVVLDTQRTRNAAEEGDRERGRGGGRQVLHHADGDVSMCILSSRDESPLLQHDSPTTYENYAYNPRPQPQQEERSSSKVDRRPKQKGKGDGNDKVEEHKRIEAQSRRRSSRMKETRIGKSWCGIKTWLSQ